jgi:polyhydroxybutyrate depolymerase
MSSRLWLVIGIAAALAVSGCSGIQRGRTATTTAAGAEPKSPTAVDDMGEIVVGGQSRSYVLHVPPHLESPRALVINLHGGGGAAAGQQRISGYDAVADANGFIVVYPQGTSNNWADGRGATDPDRLGVDDVGFVSALIDKLTAEYGIDPRWVFATGLSNGAFMAQRLACDLSEKIAAIAPVAGTLGTGVTCSPVLPVSVMEVHGTADPLVPYEGGEMTGRGGASTIVSVAATIDRWRTINGCTTEAETLRLPDNGDGTSVTKSSWSECERDTAVVLYTVTGGGHTWPGGLQYLPEKTIGTTTTQFSISTASWEFFRSHPRR